MADCQYGKVAILAVEYCRKGLLRPDRAWEDAVTSLITTSKTGRKKSCPRGTFLGLCGKGYVEGISSGKYSKSKDNMEYGEKAIRLLRDNPELVNEKTSLWRKVAPISLTHNGQMDVVIALCKQGLIRYPE